MMAHQYNPGHPFYRAPVERTDSECSSSASWQSDPPGCGYSSCSSLGTLSSQGSFLSDSGDSQSGTRVNSRVWTSVAVGPDLRVRGSSRDWPSTSTGPDLGARGNSRGWTDSQSNTGADTEEDEAGSCNYQPYSCKPYRDPVAAARQQAVNDLRAWSTELHNSFRAQEPHRPQHRDLDRLTQRHWCRLGLKD